MDKLSLRVMNRQAIHPAESVADVRICDRFLGLHESLEAQRQLVMDKHECECVVQRLRLDLLEGKCHDEQSSRDADVRCIETFCSAYECGNDHGEVAIV